MRYAHVVGEPLRVLTWNMGMGHGSAYAARHDEAWRYVMDTADVALLQEAVPPDWVPPGSVHFVPKHGGRPWGTAVLSPGLALSPVPFAPAEQRWLTAMPGSAVVVDVTLAGARSLRVASLHPRAEATEPGFTGDADMTRVKAPYQATAFPVDLVHHDLTPLLAGRRFLVGGDLNSALRFDLVGAGTVARSATRTCSRSSGTAGGGTAI